MSGSDIAVAGVPALVAEAVRRVYLDCEGHDLAANVLRAAEAGNQALRSYFTWDNDEAARAHRLAQAQDLVRRVKVKIIRHDAPEPIVVRAYVAHRELPAADDRHPGAYIAIEEIAGETEREAALMESIQRDVARLSRKYRHVSDFLAIAVAALAED